MKRSLFLTGILATVLVLSMAIVGCGDKPGDDNDGDLDLEGTITISPNTDVFINTELTATYSGTETVSYQWEKDGTDIDDETNETYTPTEAGSYTVTVRADGYNSKTSDAVTVFPIFTDIAAMSAYLDAQPNNFAATPYIIKLNVSSLPDGGYFSSYSDLQTALLNYNKYVRLDLSGSTFTTIGDNAFNGCSSLASVTLPNSITTIGDNAFFICTNLTSITIPDSVTTIGNFAFYGCASLATITVVEANANYSSTDGTLYNKDKTTLIQYPAGKTDASFTIPDSVTIIGQIAFYGCTRLTSVTILDSVTYIGSSAFRSCPNLTSVTIPDSVTYIGNLAFFDSGLTSVTLPNSVTLIEQNAFESCRNLAAITVAEANANYSSENGVLYNKDKTTLIQYPVGKTDASFTIPDSVTTIGLGAFYVCTNLTSITIPDSVTAIGDSAFRSCPNLTSITIPDSVTSIGSMAFSGCTSLVSVTFDGTIASANFDSYAFSSMGDLRDKFYATDSDNGTPGTYTRDPDGTVSVWTKQP